MLINGMPGDQLDSNDRGLLYGDGVFRTLLIKQGRPQHWPRHYRKLQHDCESLGLSCPDSEMLETELRQLAARQPEGVAKIIITRGRGERGYAPSAAAIATRILSISPVPTKHELLAGIRLHLCDLRMAHQPRLAGIKHLNRLENVLAAAEWNDPDIAEGLMLDYADNVIEGTRSNLFLVHDGTLYTPDLSRCGVAGVQRDRVLEWAEAYGINVQTGRYRLDDVLAADEVFLVNSVIGLWPVRELQQRTWDRHPMAQRIAEWLDATAD